MAGLLPYFDHVFVSESLGYRKPEKAFFDACRAFLPDVAADECMMIGDSLTADITGGKNAGMKTIWYNHTATAPFRSAARPTRSSIRCSN